MAWNSNGRRVWAGALCAALWLTAGVAKAQSVPAVHCAEEPGRQLCRSMRHLDSYLVNCDGDVCYDVFAQQITDMNAIADVYAADVDPLAAIAAPMGGMAKDLSVKICGMRWTGETSVIARIGVAANRALAALKGLQRQAGIAVPRTCVISH